MTLMPPHRSPRWDAPTALFLGGLRNQRGVCRGAQYDALKCAREKVERDGCVTVLMRSQTRKDYKESERARVVATSAVV